jgi:acetolactate synthase-1/2/3 large subunit
MSEPRSSTEWGYMTGAEGVVHSLRRAGVTQVFGIPAVESSPLFEAFVAAELPTVLVTQEQSAVHMADAHARATGSLSAAVLGPGPGLTKALTGLAEARQDSWPVLALVAAPSPLGETGSLEAARALCKRVFRLEEPEEVPAAMARAVRLALEGEPGPVLVEIPVDVQRRAGRLEGTGFRPEPREPGEEARAALDRAAELLAAARQVGLYVGSGCLGALEEVKELAEKLDAPVATSLSGLGVLPFIHPLAVGFGPGTAGAPLAQEALARCDALLAVGCKFSEAVAGGLRPGPHANLVHVDCEPAHLGRVPCRIGIAAQAKTALRHLLDRTRSSAHPEMRALIREGKRALRRELAARPIRTDAVDPVKVFIELRELMASEDVLVLDAGEPTALGLAAYPVQAPRTLLAPVDFRATGFAVPAAVAVKLARPDLRVVAVTAEDGFLQTGLELLTARRCGVAPVALVLCTGPRPVPDELRGRLLPRQALSGLTPVDHAALAEALGVRHLVVRRDAELSAVLKRALTTEAPVMVEVRVSYGELARPLEAGRRLEQGRLPRAAALRLAARNLLRRLLGRG